MRPVKVYTPRRSFRSLHYQLPFLSTLLLLVILTTVYYYAIRQHRTDLSLEQLAAFERQVQTLGNQSVYVASAISGDLLYTLAREDWATLSSRIDFVAIVYEDTPVIRCDATCVQRVGKQIQTLTQGYGVVLFECGCVLPNVVFRETDVRFGGMECAMLPGFVIAKEGVRFVHTGEKCKGVKKGLGWAWYAEHAWKLEEARRQHTRLVRRLHSGEVK